MLRPKPKFEVQTYTWMDGWVNVWSEEGYDANGSPVSEPLYFDTREEAEAAIVEFFEDLQLAGMDAQYDRGDYRVWQVQ